MSKEDEIRKLREAKYERDQKRARKAAPINQKEPRAEDARARDRADQPRVARRGLEARNASNGEAAEKLGKPSQFDRTEYQRKYMRGWRAKRTAELKRLRELVKDGK